MESPASPAPADAGEESAKLMPLPDVGDLLFVGVMQILLFGRPEFMFQDASIGWHLVTGEWIFQNRAIPHTDLFSYTFADKPWVAYEWLFDLIAYMLTAAGGLYLLAVVVAATIAFVLMKVYDRARTEGGPLGLTATITTVAIFASSIHWLARPHIVTLLCVFIYVTKLEDYYRGTITGTRLILYLSLLMLLWVNCHPAFAIGVVLIGIYFLAAFLSMLKAKPEEKNTATERVKTLFIAGAATGVVTLFNPYGLQLHHYILEYLKGSTILANTDEFKSPVFHLDDIHYLNALCLEVLVAVFLAGLAVSKRRPSLPYFTAVLLFMHMSLSAVRNIPLFAIVVTPAIGLLFSKTKLQDTNRPWNEIFPMLQDRLAKFSNTYNQFSEQEMVCKMRVLPIAYVLFVAIAAICGGSLFGNKILHSGFSEKEFPTKTLAYIQEKKLPYDRGFNYDNWGGLLRYKLKTRVYIDDRADFYGEQFYSQYGKIVLTEPGWRELLDKEKIEWILMPENAVLTVALKEKPGHWKIAAEDEASVLFVRTPL